MQRLSPKILKYDSLAFRDQTDYCLTVMLKRLMGVALTLVLLFSTWINAFHTHVDYDIDHVDVNHIDVDHNYHTTISSLELETDCSLCDHLIPNGERLVKKVVLYFLVVEHKTPLSSQSFERTEVRPIAMLTFAPKTSPPLTFKRI